MSALPDTRPVFCSRCWRAQTPGEMLCLQCGCDAWSSGRLESPDLLSKAERYELPFPWNTLEDWQPGSTVLVSGGPGSGKSSLGALLNVDLWVTTEQTPSQAGNLLARCCRKDRDIPALYPAYSPRQVVEAVEGQAGGLVVLDSITASGSWIEQADILYSLVSLVQARGMRLLVIQQVNGAGTGAGLTELAHLVEAVGTVEKSILRRLDFSKNRMGAVGSALFCLGADGVTAPDLSAASYSVEGEPGAYSLHPYPLPGAKWSGLFKQSWKDAQAVPGLASAAIPVPGYPGGVLLPQDVEARRAFAERHGLLWVEDAFDEKLLQEREQ